MIYDGMAWHSSSNFNFILCYPVTQLIFCVFYRNAQNETCCWVSFLDGTQRVLLFTKDFGIAAEAHSASRLDKVSKINYIVFFEFCSYRRIIVYKLVALVIRWSFHIK